MTRILVCLVGLAWVGCASPNGHSKDHLPSGSGADPLVTCLDVIDGVERAFRSAAQHPQVTPEDAAELLSSLDDALLRTMEFCRERMSPADRRCVASALSLTDLAACRSIRVDPENPVDPVGDGDP